MERNAFWLGDVNGLEIIPESTFLLDRFRVVAVWRSLADGSSYRRHVDVNNFLGLCIINGTEVEWVRVL